MQMTNTPVDVEKAQALVAEGYGYVRLARALNISQRQAMYFTRGADYMRETNRTQNLRRRAAKTAWERQQKAECPQCGGPMRYRQSKLCIACATANKNEGAAKRRERIAALWNEGAPLRVIARELDSTPNSIGVEIDRMRKAGMDMPLRRPRKEAA